MYWASALSHDLGFPKGAKQYAFLRARSRLLLCPGSGNDRKGRSVGNVCPRPAAKPGVSAWVDGNVSRRAGLPDSLQCPGGTDDPLRLTVFPVPPLRSLVLGWAGPLALAPWVRFAPSVAPALRRRSTTVGVSARPSPGVFGVDLLLRLAGRLPLFAGVCLKSTDRFVRSPEEQAVVSVPDLEDVEGGLVRDIAAFHSNCPLHPLEHMRSFDLAPELSLEDVAHGTQGGPELAGIREAFVLGVVPDHPHELAGPISSIRPLCNLPCSRGTSLRLGFGPEA